MSCTTAAAIGVAAVLLSASPLVCSSPMLPCGRCGCLAFSLVGGADFVLPSFSAISFAARGFRSGWVGGLVRRPRRRLRELRPDSAFSFGCSGAGGAAGVVSLARRGTAFVARVVVLLRCAVPLAAGRGRDGRPLRRPPAPFGSRLFAVSPLTLTLTGFVFEGRTNSFLRPSSNDRFRTGGVTRCAIGPTTAFSGLATVVVVFVSVSSSEVATS